MPQECGNLVESGQKCPRNKMFPNYCLEFPGLENVRSSGRIVYSSYFSEVPSVLLRNSWQTLSIPWRGPSLQNVGTKAYRGCHNFEIALKCRMRFIFQGLLISNRTNPLNPGIASRMFSVCLWICSGFNYLELLLSLRRFVDTLARMLVKEAEKLPREALLVLWVASSNSPWKAVSASSSYIILRAACLQNETAPEKLLNRYEKRFEKREKRSEKRSEACLKHF